MVLCPPYSMTHTWPFLLPSFHAPLRAERGILAQVGYFLPATTVLSAQLGADLAGEDRKGQYSQTLPPREEETPPPQTQ